MSSQYLLLCYSSFEKEYFIILFYIDKVVWWWIVKAYHVEYLVLIIQLLSWHHLIQVLMLLSVMLLPVSGNHVILIKELFIFIFNLYSWQCVILIAGKVLGNVVHVVCSLLLWCVLIRYDSDYNCWYYYFLTGKKVRRMDH